LDGKVGEDDINGMSKRAYFKTTKLNFCTRKKGLVSRKYQEISPQKRKTLTIFECVRVVTER
jgi:hypothetical protein